MGSIFNFFSPSFLVAALAVHSLAKCSVLFVRLFMLDVECNLRFIMLEVSSKRCSWRKGQGWRVIIYAHMRT